MAFYVLSYDLRNERDYETLWAELADFGSLNPYGTFNVSRLRQPDYATISRASSIQMTGCWLWKCRTGLRGMHYQRRRNTDDPYLSRNYRPIVCPTFASVAKPFL
jgi:hypothetical protein